MEKICRQCMRACKILAICPKTLNFRRGIRCKNTNAICVKHFWTRVKFSRISAKNYPICEICRIQIKVFKKQLEVFLCQSITSAHDIKGRVRLPNQINFRKNFKRPSSPPSFSENHTVIFFMTDMVAYMRGGVMARQYEMHAHDFQNQGPFSSIGKEFTVKSEKIYSERYLV